MVRDLIRTGRETSVPGILPVPMGTARTLIVDDHADVRFLIRAIVGDSGLPIEVVGEADGLDSALAQLDALDPDVVVLDARMPRVDGFEVARLLLERRPGLPIVLCSAWVDDDVRERAAAAGIREVLSKDQFDEIPAAIVRLAATP
jgi:DNA-binding NarL/FixJ family response regulator